MADDEVKRSAVDVLARVSGISEADLRELWEYAQSNNTVLERCKGPHEFVRISLTLPSRYRCLTCGGEVDAHAAIWYRAGLQAGRRE